MSKIKEMFDTLEADQRDLILSAFNEGRDQIIILGDGRFIGVNIPDIGDLNIIQAENDWFCGTLKEEE